MYYMQTLNLRNKPFLIPPPCIDCSVKNITFFGSYQVFDEIILLRIFTIYIAFHLGVSKK